MPLEVTPVYRNLRTRVTFFGLEAEDLNREMFGVPMNIVLQYVVPILMVPALMLFKYGKQRAYLQDWVMFHARPHVYSALERDSQFTREYINTEGN